MSRTFQQALETLYGLERRRDKLGLEGTVSLMRALGHPERRFRAVHVAGTNGKGSVCAMIERGLREAGLATGLYTSPHLVDFRERIRVRGRWAGADALEARLAHVQSLPEGSDRTFFEVATALAFDHFARSGVEWGVVEVGLGGRLDCTNVIAPELCVITSIALDHVEILGGDLASIAAEKAGVVKSGVPVVLSPAIPAAARAVIERVARDRGAPVVDVPPGVVERLPEVLRDSHQRLNAGIALVALERLAADGAPLDAAAIGRGLTRARWPGRLEACPDEPRLWWDGAHNEEAMEHLTAAWGRAHVRPPAAIVLALSRDKNAARMCGILARCSTAPRVIATRTRNPRAMEPAALAAAAREAGFETSEADGVASGVRRALAGTRGAVLVAGSLFAVGEAMEAFGGAPGELQ